MYRGHCIRDEICVWCLSAAKVNALREVHMGVLLQSQTQEELPPCSTPGVLREMRCHRPRALRHGFASQDKLREWDTVRAATIGRGVPR